MGSKNSASGPIWAVAQERLTEAVDHEQHKFADLLSEFKPELTAETLNLLDAEICVTLMLLRNS